MWTLAYLPTKMCMDTENINEQKNVKVHVTEIFGHKVQHMMTTTTIIKMFSSLSPNISLT